MSEARVTERLIELEERTRGIGASAAFRARALTALATRAQATVRAEVVRSARIFVPAAFVLAAIALGAATRASGPSSADIVAAEQRWEREF
jgi:hypothetical protein